MAKIDRRKRLYYPYCGAKLGFCLATDIAEKGCTVDYELISIKCRYWRYRHPITKSPPQSLMGGR